MGACCKFLFSSIGKKVLMALTGMGLSLFLLAHVAGNLLVLIDRQKFNDYALGLEKMGYLLYAAEAGLLAVFALHILVALVLTRQNQQARPESYYSRKSSGRSRRTWGSSHMILTGSLILIFVVYHLNHFKFGETEMLSSQGVVMRDLAGLVLREFSEGYEVWIYLVALVAITVHWLHGFRSMFETLGLSNSRWEPFLKWFTRLFVFLVMGGFMAIPLAIYFGAAP